MREEFRPGSAALWRLSGALAVALFPMVIHRAFRMPEFEVLPIVAAFASLLLSPVWVFALGWPLLRVYRVEVYQQGLRGYDAWGRIRRVRWSAMSGAEIVAFPGAAWVRVPTREIGVTLTIPCFLAQQQRFEQMVIELAGPANPLARHYAAHPSPA